MEVENYMYVHGGHAPIIPPPPPDPRLLCEHGVVFIICSC